MIKVWILAEQYKSTSSLVLILMIGWKVLLSEIIWRLQVQSQQLVKLTRNTYNNIILVPGYG